MRAAVPDDADELANIMPSLFPKLQERSHADLEPQVKSHPQAAQATSHSLFVAEMPGGIIG